MTTAVASILTGVVLALVAVVGGVSAVSPTVNSADQTEQVVTYDAQ